jgi:hypothetical protein
LAALGSLRERLIACESRLVFAAAARTNEGALAKLKQ